VRQAFLNSGLRTDTPIFKRAQAVFSRMSNKSKTAAGVLAALAEKGIIPELGLVDYITETFCGYGKSDGGTRRQKKREQRGDEPGFQSIVTQLKLQIETPGSQDSLLHLFNHLKGKGESWVLLPYKVSSKGREVGGTIRLRIGEAGKINRVAMDALSEKSPFAVSFRWPFAAGDAITVRSTDKRALSSFASRVGELPEKLRNLNSIIDDNIIEEGRFDGLSLEDDTRARGVDSFA
jgi:hypothetical protein